MCKALSRRFDKYVPNLIIDDQQAFVKTREGYHNIKRVLNVLYEENNGKGTPLLSLDACKAFDRIEWIYLLQVLPKYGLGETFLKWIRFLYTSQIAQVLTNNNMSKPFNLQQSTRQGCPLSVCVSNRTSSYSCESKYRNIRYQNWRKRPSNFFICRQYNILMTNLKDSIPNLV